MSKILVTGGCGYIGSHTIVDLIDKGYGQVVSLDNLYNSYANTLERVERITGAAVENHRLDLRDQASLASFFDSQREIETVIHFAALKSVGESVEDPLTCFEFNISGMINLLKMVEKHRIPNFIFSSSCTVYGDADQMPVAEQSPLKPPLSPYGRTKQVCEGMLLDLQHVNDWLNVVILRYFNPAGAHHSGMLGENSRQKATELVPVITETAVGERKEMTVYGTDYPTRDGSCIRDYIHIEDLASAHSLALQYLEKGAAENPAVFNLGTGNGVTVLEAIKAFEKVTGQKLNYRLGDRRPGDVPAIYSAYDKARKILGWEPRYGIEDIMRTAWRFTVGSRQ